MAIEIVMPRLGLTMEEGTVVFWHKREGDPVRAGEVLLEVETDKVTQEVECKADGVLGKILVPEGSTVPIGIPIAYLIAPGEDVSLPAAVHQVASVRADRVKSEPATRQHEENADADFPTRASPAARRVSRQLGLDLNRIAGSGPLGRVLETDVRRAWQQLQTTGPSISGQASTVPTKRLTPVAARIVADLGTDISEIQGTGPGGLICKSDLPETLPVESDKSPFKNERLEVRGAHKVMAERMATSFSTAPHFYLMVQADATLLVELRRNLTPKVEARANIRLTYTDLLAFFVTAALKEHPLLNAAWDHGAIQMHPDVNLGLAVDSLNGLVVPVIHSVQNLSLIDLARNRAELVEKARNGKLNLDDLSGGTFTLSNLGSHQVDLFNAVLNPPQAAILAVGRIHEAVIPHQGQVALRKVVGLSLTCDHRVLDGAAGACFLDRLVELVEQPFSFFI